MGLSDRSKTTLERINLMIALAANDSRAIAQAMRKKPDAWFLNTFADILEQPIRRRAYAAQLKSLMLAAEVLALKQKKPSQSLNQIIRDVARRRDVSERTVRYALAKSRNLSTAT